MQEYVINRPETAAMERILEQNKTNAAGAILRLAWQAGLLREEVQQLSWAQVDLVARQILLPDRVVPLSEELACWLAELRDSRVGRWETVVLSDRDCKPLSPQSISRLARTVLDKEGQTSVRLIDLRHDYILRQLEEYDWQYVSRITGVEAAALNAHFAAHLPEKRVSTRIRREEPAQIDEFALWKLLQAERGTPAGVALWLTWQLGLKLDEIVALQWSQVDFKRSRLKLADREVPLTSGVVSALQQLTPEQPADGPVITAPRSGQPYDRTRLSRLVRSALVKGGMDNVTLRDLRQDHDIRVGGEDQITSYLRQHRSITRMEAAARLGVGKAAAYGRLQQMVKRGRLTQVGAQYYLKGTVVPPEEQEAAIVAYLEETGFAYRQDIARLLGVDAAQCRPVLQRMIKSGVLLHEKQRYTLLNNVEGAVAAFAEEEERPL